MYWEKLSHRSLRVHNVYGTRGDANARVSGQKTLQWGRGDQGVGRGGARPGCGGSAGATAKLIPHYDSELFSKS